MTLTNTRRATTVCSGYSLTGIIEMDSNGLLDAYKARLQLASDYALAKHWNIRQNSVRQMRAIGLSDERALLIAGDLDLPAGEVLANIHAERAKHPEVKAAWQKVAESMRSALGVVAVLVALPLVTAPNAPGSTIYAAPEHCILCKIVRRLRRALAAFLAVFFLSLSTACGYQPPGPPASCETQPSGLCVGYDTPGGAAATLYERAYLDAQQCMAEHFGTDAGGRPPVVRVTDGPIFGRAGWTDWGTLQITIQKLPDYETYFLMRHESAHFILSRDTGDGHGGHDHPAFAQATATGICDAYPAGFDYN